MYPSQSHQSPAQPSQSPGPASPRSGHGKVISQRQYRANEGECFNALREVIKELTGEDLETRQEILKRAIDLLRWTASEIRKSRQVQVAHPASYEIPSVTKGTTPAVHMGHTAGPSSWQPSWHHDSAIQPGQQSAPYIHAPQSHGQQDYSTFTMGSAMNNTTSPGYSEQEGWAGQYSQK